MLARSFGTCCSLLLAWLCALGAGSARHPELRSFVVRGAVELALRDAVETPLVGTRAVAARITSSRLVERDAPPTPAPLASRRAALLADPASITHATLERQSAEHAGRPRWRVYDPAAPPPSPA
jgi:hypothetical protein